MRKIGLPNILILYFNRFPFILGEIILGVGIYFIIDLYPDPISLIGLLIIAVGSFIIRYKLLSAKKSIYILQNGLYTTSKLTYIGDTGYRHNSRRIRSFVFEYVVNKKKYFYQYKSGYHKNLSEGDEFVIYYIENNPEKAIIPILYSVYIYS